MSQLCIRGLEPEIKQRLRMAAAAHGRSMEAEAREILRQAMEKLPVKHPQTPEELRRRIAAARGVWKDRGTTEDLLRLTRGED
jgi:plasmid stability protein